MNISKKNSFFTSNIMLWNNENNKRILPWKGEPDPYKIWLSEIILQQTRVDQGLEYYKKFIEKYPKVELLAIAEENEVFKLWEGLGYYSRCKNLIKSAKNIAFEQNGIFPNEYHQIIKLNGVGPYTAAAIASFAFNLPYAVLDGNVFRVIARFFEIDIPTDSIEGKKYFTTLAQTLLDKDFPAMYNQAIMDFGATVCKPQLPLCPTCVLQTNCKAYKNNMVKELPVKQKKLIKRFRYFYYIIVEYNNKIYVRKRITKDIWQNLWEFILIENDKKISVEEFVNTTLFTSLFTAKNRNVKTGVFYKQQLTHQTIEGTFIYVKLAKPFKNEFYMALEKNELSTLPFPRFITRFLEENTEFKMLG